MTTLPNGKPIDMEMLEVAMEDSNLTNTYYLNTQTGEVLFLSEDDDMEKQEQLAEEIEGSNDYVRIERIPSSEAYQWMNSFVEEIVAPKDQRAAQKLSAALQGKGAFRRFKNTLYTLGEQWTQTWYDWRDQQLKEAMEAWLREVL
ncbi:hypothetical protein KSD_47160 [Ktedonobacter sp. SOSP1-85]|uniref:UPF0158 family protein n=1 Tax=Ktedonobacter sp. SOSP1-85 TaxID=2778367 RepID=UPI0019154271|nr:UPF0158 family protein [Ktedonobacter sp. SOSP1-85]GHO76945.1 hypothetical protein KSD_47160 [Ktedonobacter sp. SOSP1-85]